MAAIIKYDNFVFNPDNGFPEPYVSVTEEEILGTENTGQMMMAKSIELEGYITGNSTQDIYEKRYDLITGLKRAYKEFVVTEDTSGTHPSTTSNYTDAHGVVVKDRWGLAATDADLDVLGRDIVISGACVKIEEISFDESIYWEHGGMLGYSITLSNYNTGSTYDDSPVKFVLNPTDQIEYSEDENGIVEISHKISAQGINSDPVTTNALENAKIFVHDHTGIKHHVLPKFISDTNQGNAVLVAQSESTDRIEGSYSVDESWKYFPAGSATTATMQKYSVSYGSGMGEEFLSANTSLEIIGHKDIDMGTIRGEVPTISTIQSKTETLIGYSSLSNLPNSYSVEEDEDAKKIKISVEFDNNENDFVNSAAVPFFDYGISIKEDWVTKTTEVSIQGDLSIRKNAKYSWSEIQQHFDDVISEEYLYDLATGHYRDIIGTRFVLNPEPTSYSSTEKSGDPSISVNISFTDKDWITGFSAAEYSISQTPSIAQYRPKASAIHNGEYVVSYLGYYNREKIGFDLSLTPNTGVGATLVRLAHEQGGAATLGWGIFEDPKVWPDIYSTPHSYALNIKDVITGKGFNIAAFPLESNMYNAAGPPIGQDSKGKYGVRLEKEDFSYGQAGNDKISYSYEYTKPANTSVDIHIP